MAFEGVKSKGEVLYALFDLVPFYAWWFVEYDLVLPWRDYVF